MRNPERRLLAIGARQGRSIALGEQRHGEGDYEERDSRHGRARPSRESDRGQTRREPSRPAIGSKPGERGEEPRDREGRSDRDEAGHEQEQQCRSFSTRELFLVRRATDERDGDDERGGERHDVERAETSTVARGQRDRDPHEDGCDRCRHDGDSEPGGRDDAFSQDVTHGRSGKTRDGRTDRDAGGPAQENPDEGDRARLEGVEQPELPALRPEPRESAASGLEVASHAARGEDGERQQQRGALAADEQEARARHFGRPLGVPQLLDGRIDPERRRSLGELDAGTLAPRQEPVDVPQPWLAGSDGPDPRVRPIRAGEKRRGRESVTAFGDDERRWSRSVVLARPAELRRNRRVRDRRVVRQQEVAVELPRAQARRADLNETEARDSGQLTAPSEAENLAAAERARPRQAAGPKDDVVGHTVDRRQADEASRDGALAKEDERRRPREADLAERTVDRRVERREPLARVAGNAEPGSSERAFRGRHSLDRLRGRAIGRDRHAGQHSGEHRGRHDEPEHRDEHAAVAPTQSLPCEPSHHPRTSHSAARFRLR